jgi:hypothetical protein
MKSLTNLVSAATPDAGSHPKRNVKLEIELASVEANPLAGPPSAISVPYSTPFLPPST